MATDPASIELSIAPASPSKALFEIEQQAHRLHWSVKVFFGSTGPSYRWREARWQQQPIGFTVCQQIADELTLHNIAVSPQHQGRGVGRLLLDEIIAHAQANGLTIFLEVRDSNTRAIDLYQRNGFAVVGRRPNYYPTEEGREDGLVMSYQAS